MPVKLGWKKDPPSVRDHDATFTLRATAIPRSASLRHLVVSVLDQASIGACVAHSVLQAVRINHKKQGIPYPKLGSRLFGYYVARSYQGPQAIVDDGGTFLRSFFDGLNKFGFCAEDKWPYDPAKFNHMPPPAAFQAAFDQRSPTVYKKIMSTGKGRLDDIRRAIAAGYAVCFGSMVSEAFCNGDLGTGPIEPPLGMPLAGGHALCCIEYDGDAFGIVNSWGTNWGNRGYCEFSARYMSWAETTDLWLVQQSPKYSEPATLA